MHCSAPWAMRPLSAAALADRHRHKLQNASPAAQARHISQSAAPAHSRRSSRRQHCTHTCTRAALHTGNRGTALCYVWGCSRLCV